MKSPPVQLVPLVQPDPIEPARPLPIWVHVAALGPFVLLIGILIGITWGWRGRNVWDGWVEARELHHPDYAERILSAEVFRTPANTWSNLAFVLVGLYALALGNLDWRRPPPSCGNYLAQTPALSWLFGVLCCYLGLASGWYHASLTRLGQQLDVAAMYAPLLALIAINLGRFMPRVPLGSARNRLPSWPLWTVGVIVGCFVLFWYKWSMRSFVVLPTLILSVTAFTLLDRVLANRKFRVRWMLASGAALVAARVCWQMDLAGKFSGPDAWFQGHAVWHLLTALSLGCIYLYYRSEVIVDSRRTQSPSNPARRRLDKIK